METITINNEVFQVKEEIYASYTKEIKKGSAPILTIRKRRFFIKPKLKFVRRADREYTIDKQILGTYEITIPYTFKKVTKSRSWLGDGMQQDDINCHSEWEVDEVVYDETALKNFIEEKLLLHKAPLKIK